MKRIVLAVVIAVSSSALALESQVLPKNTFLIDVGLLSAKIETQWGGNRQRLALVDDNYRYEPGGGLQGILRARPVAQIDFLLMQVLYGITDSFTAGVALPLMLSTRIATNFSWTPGDYQSQLGRQYSQDDFWAWAGSLGQPRLPDQTVLNTPTLGDIVLNARYLLPVSESLKAQHWRWSATLQGAIRTGTNPDPEEAVSIGTNLWELNAAGDIELHVSGDKLFFVDDDGISRVSVGGDVFGSLFLPRTYVAGKGVKNPLLNNIAPYVGDTYTVDPGEWFGTTLSFDVVPFIGPARASFISQNNLEAARKLPPLVTITGGYTFIATAQSDWRSNSALYDWDREKVWQPGEKHALRVSATVNLLRLGVPLMLYVGYRSQDLIPGRFNRAPNTFSAGVRVPLKFW